MNLSEIREKWRPIHTVSLLFGFGLFGIETYKIDFDVTHHSPIGNYVIDGIFVAVGIWRIIEPPLLIDHHIKREQSEASQQPIEP